ncbi:tRNA pseudouridine(38-40) synthase TruA [Ectobacillus antri]|jgi:tRNA pseudouridine38-40 synthase|uniref:tRNA pseudouridine synthase A n=1 Tax=Ectobacillus antri TaxID=2486280 RepID=A0ABT6H4W1_9BACI|nr:tRNA pseudouridine(38-40) synthase TruA [Ectobacillus antri]MDG4657254.1 tRNA pseudouridine(38-40) synthase TruA [Ectobacillus antri]MDG5754394.1 tRNA pseudouridine(38-40) synthase TruA [Ectobacillus antri]
MNNYKMLIQYDGSRYKGWQRLGNGENTIQGKIEHVLSEMVGRPIEIIGCSRTDAGVHAFAQIANFKLEEQLPVEEIQAYLHKYLPNDISVVQVEETHERFHARYNAKAKTYVYKIWNEQHTNPFMRKYSMHVTEKLDIAKMKQAARHFVGKHDFTAFSNAKSKKKSMVREIYAIEIIKEGSFIYIRVKGDGFLYNMVRKIVATLIEVGNETRSEATIPEMIASKDRSVVTSLADAAGLHLEHVEF